jgi:hypothetical protein
VLKENNLIFNLKLKSITEQLADVKPYVLAKSVGNYYTFDKIPQTGSLLNGKLFTSFTAGVDLDFGLVYIRAVW